jgi:hypothetical protein
VARENYTYAAVSCYAVRTFRLHRLPPICVEFYAIRYSVELYSRTGTANSECLVARLPWQDANYARELDHAGAGVIRQQLLSAYDVDCGNLAEVLFLRMVRQGDAVELAGPHVKIPSEHGCRRTPASVRAFA